MTKRSTSKSSRSSSQKSGGGSTNPIIALIVIVIVVIAGFFGLDLSGLLGTTDATTAPPTSVVVVPGNVTAINVGQGFGAQKGFWQVYFTAPTGSSDRSTYRGGIEENLAAAINGVQQTLDIAAFEWNTPTLTNAVVAAAGRGVRVRMVTDDEHGIEDTDSTIDALIQAGVQVVDDGRSAFMHNKFMILDSTTVWMGSWNYTMNDTYRNNNNALVLRSRQAVQAYQTEFNEMFVNGQFGPRSPVNNPNPSFSQDGTPIQIYFGAEDEVETAIINTLNSAQRSIRFMAFSFTLDDVAAAVLNRAQAGVNVTGVFEGAGSEGQASELRPMFCAGLDVRQDGGSFILHHKVFIVDDSTVIAGSFNFSASARDSNDENVVIITDPDLAAQYTAEFNRRFAEGRRPSGIACN
ncbi:MAG: DUF1669 domain-containing protein [Anaerolinea sp.]|nr:DUF1669 domain-containing protein [Anaerolinea sp.]